jgi:hypothetical protein
MVIIVFPGLVMFFYITTRLIVTVFIALCSKTITDWSDFIVMIFWFLGTLPIMVLLASACWKLFHKICDWVKKICQLSSSKSNDDNRDQRIPAAFLLMFLISMIFVELTFWV